MNADKSRAVFQGSGLKASLVRSGARSILLRVLVFSLSLLMTMVLARVLGAEDFGFYAYAMSIITLLSIPAQIGLPTIIVRETARLEASGRWGLIRGLWRWSGNFVLITSLVLVALSLLIAWIGVEVKGSVQLQTFFVALPLIPLLALGGIRGAALRGLRHVIKGQMPENVIRPIFLIVMVLCLYFFWPGAISSVSAMLMHSFAAALAFLIGAYMLWSARPEGLINRPAPEYESRYWQRSIVPLSLIAGANVINSQADILMIGWIGQSQEVGIYRVVVSSVLLINFGKQAIVSVVSPYFARMYYRLEFSSLQKLVTKSNQVVFILSLPPFLLFLICGEWLLGFVFGIEYSAGYIPLVILSFGYVIGMGMGSAAALLNMAGCEKFTAVSVAVSAFINVVLNIFFIPLWGISGAALAMTISMSVGNVIIWFVAYKKLGVKAGILAGLNVREK